MTILRSVISLCIACSLMLSLHAQETVDRPRIGLALSGGGTKAGAHIGVLRVLEEYRVPIDYIAGTSAGAIIGGLYAAGLSPDEIEAAIASIDWDDIVRDAPLRSDLPFRRKRDDFNYLVKSRPGFSDGRIKLPMGLVEGQKVTHFLRRHLARVDGTENFDALPIPLRVIATDLETGGAVVIETGDLALAIRASMSIPVFFSPVVIDGRRLIDGGPANNLPIDIVRQLGADVVIAVDISAPMLSGDEIDSVLSVTDQLTNFLTRQNVQQRLATMSPTDILLQPELTDFGALDFEKTLAAVGPGERATRNSEADLTTLALDEERYHAYLADLRSERAPRNKTIGFVDVNNLSSIGTETIKHRLGFGVGDDIDREKIESGIANVYGLDIFERIDYRIDQRDSVTGVVVDVVPKPWGPNYLQFGLQLSEDFSTGSDFNIGIAYLRTAINTLGGEWRAQLDLGERQGISANWFQPLSHQSGYFVEAESRIIRRNFRFFEDTAAVADLRVSGWGGNLSFGKELGASGEVRAGWNRFFADADIAVGQLELADDRANVGEVFVSASYDRLDNTNFPTRGTSIAGSVGWSRSGVGADNNFEQLSGAYFAANSWGEYTLLTSIEAGTTPGEDAPLQSQFLLGGLGRLSGYPTNRFLGQHYSLLNATAYRHLRRSLWLPIYAGLSLEVGDVWNDRDDINSDSLRFAGALYAGADTFLGPLYLAWGLAEGGENTVYLHLGNPFTSRGIRPLD